MQEVRNEAPLSWEAALQVLDSDESGVSSELLEGLEQASKAIALLNDAILVACSGERVLTSIWFLVSAGGVELSRI